MHRPFWPSDGV